MSQNKTYLFADSVDLSSISDDQLSQLKVRNNRDAFSATTRIYELSTPLQLTPEQTRADISRLRQQYTVDMTSLRCIAKDFREYLMFVFRWRARGLSLDQSIRKAEHAAAQRSTWATHQRSYWRR